MLSKKICKKCVNERSLVDDLRNWNVIDEQDWAGGSDFSCVFRVIGIKNGPPDDCFYFTEQFLYHDATEKKKVKC